VQLVDSGLPIAWSYETGMIEKLSNKSGIIKNIAILTQSKRIFDIFGKRFRVIFDLDDTKTLDVIVMVSYGKMIPSEFLNHGRPIFLNVHNSLLPKYRGLHAFTWAMINGDTQTGYTLHVVDEGIDSGPIISQISFDIHEDWDINDLFRKGYEVLSFWLPDILDSLTWNDIRKAEPQNHKEATYVTKRHPEDGRINWQDTSRNIHNFVRALAPPYTPGAFTFYKDQKIHLLKTKLLNGPDYICISGKIVCIDNDGWIVKTGDNCLKIISVKLNGKVLQATELPVKVGSKLE